MRSCYILNHRHLYACLLVGMVLLGAGCGGSGVRVSPVGSNGFANAKVPIRWGARSRAIGGPGSALSVVITFDLAGTTHQSVSMEADRNLSPGAYQQTYLTTETVRLGVESIHVSFYSEAGAQGSLVAEADASVLVKTDGALARATGSPLGTIQANGQVAWVSISGPQTISIGAPQAISTAVFDAHNDLLAVSGGSVFYQVINGTGSATIDSSGEITGVTSGSVSVTATVDGISSLPIQVIVTSQALPMSSLTQPTVALAVHPLTGNIWATVPATEPKYGNSVIEIDYTTHQIVSTIPVGSSPTVLAFSDDGTALYVGLQGAGSYARVDPIGKTLVASYPLSSTGFGGAQYATAIAVQPGHPNVVAVCEQDDSDSGFTGGCIYNNGVLLPNNMGIYNGYVLGFSNATTLWGSDPGFSPQSIFEATVDATGATLTNTNDGLGGSFSVLGGNLYFTNGQVVSGVTGNLMGTYPVQGFGQGAAVDFASQTAYIIQQSSGSYQVSSYGAANFKSISAFGIPSGPTAINSFSLAKGGQFVFADGAKVYFVQLPSNSNSRNRSARTKS